MNILVEFFLIPLALLAALGLAAWAKQRQLFPPGGGRRVRMTRPTYSDVALRVATFLFTAYLVSAILRGWP